MTVQPARPASPDGLFVWVMHRFAEVFSERAILKGGIALRLLDCPRSTTDIDYEFVPRDSKRTLRDQIATALGALEHAEISITVHSRLVRAVVTMDQAAILIEATFEDSCPSTAVPTVSLALPQQQPSRIVRIMALDHALANKLAAWNERRLARDLYDCYFLHTLASV